ncbi:MAG: EAL domain-containing protein, partial [Cyanobacteria bacterium J06642_11]
LNIHVNLSEQSLDHSLLSRLEDLLHQHQLQGQNIILEMTEKTLMKTLETSQNLLDRIKAHNIHLAIDDFGTGYACLRYLSQLPISTLKIDRSFISPSDFETRGHAIAESMITLCHTLGLQTIAEGIETHHQLTWLRELECPLGQGYYFAHPLPATAATELLAQETV